MKSPRESVESLPVPVAGSRRAFLKKLFTTGTLLTLNYASVASIAAETAGSKVYRRFEDVYRKKWTWDRIAHGTHGTNCMGNCAFDVYVKNGIVWREEQQGVY